MPDAKKLISVPVDKDTFGVRLRLAIAAKATTADQLARRTGVSPNTISRYLSDATMPSLETAVSLARVLGVSLAFFEYENVNL